MPGDTVPSGHCMVVGVSFLFSCSYHHRGGWVAEFKAKVKRGHAETWGLGPGNRCEHEFLQGGLAAALVEKKVHSSLRYPAWNYLTTLT